MIQKNTRFNRKPLESVTYGIYSLPEERHGEKHQKPIEKDFFESVEPVALYQVSMNLRQIVGRHVLKPGHYLIVPATPKPAEAEFLLRIFTQCQSLAEEKEESVAFKDNDLNLAQILNHHQLVELFLRLAGRDQTIRWIELQTILNQALREGR